MRAVACSPSGNRFTDRVFELLEIVDYRLVVTDAERDAVFRLRYDAYLHAQFIKPDFSRRLTDRFDDLDNAWIFGLYIEEQLVGTMRLHVTADGYPDLPATGVFDDHLSQQIALGKTIIDPTRHAIDPKAARMYPKLAYATTRIGWMAGEYFGADQILATVRTQHQAFYRRIFGHQVVAEARPYYSLAKPLSLMVLDYPAVRDRVHQRYPFYRSSYFERRALFEAPGLPANRSAKQPCQQLGRGAPKAAPPRSGRTSVQEPIPLSA